MGLCIDQSAWTAQSRSEQFRSEENVSGVNWWPYQAEAAAATAVATATKEFNRKRGGGGAC